MFVPVGYHLMIDRKFITSKCKNSHFLLFIQDKTQLTDIPIIILP